ncbi:MAG: hypothetical protein KJ887_02085 [Candidatus Omnitrophica bacterium]|nr:hypothetical protein [Candidatus Omnitrophota bacterium]MBU1047851.1 hypothetical protein [Candidatus Omnitrophota bacterium]MBU1630204.1 hypothetical protein [Candidatus Omnitrophota bacterium]MBU1888474.1 hypothetical protein [Candidatus Omnitrophota bacterium]
MQKILCLAFLFFVVLFSANLYADSLPFKVEGEKVDYLIKDELVIAIDKASIEYKDIKIFADRLEINITTQEVKAINNVYYVKDQNTVQADYLFYNLKENTGYFSDNIRGVFPPWHWEGEKIEILSKDEFVLSRGSFTTCDHEPPHYHLSCSSATLDIEDKATAKNVLFYLGSIPIFYLPFYYTYMRHPPYGLVNWVGHSQEKGWMDLAHYNWYVNKKFRGRLYLDYIENLGWGQGFDIDLKTDGGKNYIYGYYMDEDGRFYGGDNIKRYGGTAEGNDKYKRWKGIFKHKQQWQGDWRSMMKIERFSDENFNKDFFFEEMNKGEERFTLSRDPENYFALEQIKPDYNSIFYTNAALNDFEYLVQRQPSISFTTREQAIKNSPFYYKVETNYSHFKEAFPEEENIEEDTELDRLDLFAKLSAPHRMNKWITSEPYLDFRGTRYSEDTEEKTAFRTTEGIGWNLRSKLAKQYGDVQHIFQPQIGYYYRPEPNIHRNELIRLDPIDRITSQNGFFVEIVNRLKVPQYKQTEEYAPYKDLDEIYLREARTPESIISSSIQSYPYDDSNLISESDETGETTYTEPFNLRVFSNYSVKEEQWDYVFIENTLIPIPGISFVSDATYTPQTDQFEIVNSTLGVSKWEKVGGSLGLSYYRTEDLYRVDGNIWFDLSPTVQLQFSTAYDMENEFIRSNGVYIKKDLHCWTAELQMNNYKRTRNENYTFEIFFTLSISDLSGFKLPLSGTITPTTDEQ